MSSSIPTGLKKVVVQTAILGMLVLLWEWLVSLTPGTLVPGPLSCLRALRELVTDGILWPDLIASLQRVSVGFLMAVGAGLVIGFSLGLVKSLRDVFGIIFELFRPIPPIAWIPIAVAILGIGDASAWFVIFIGAFYPVMTNTLLGVSGVEKLHIEAAKVLGATKLRTFFHVIWPSSLPSLFAGLRVGLGFAWMCVVAAEMFASRSGLGYEIQLNRQLFQLDRVVAGMITIAVVGYLMTRFMAGLEWLVIPWRREFRALDFFSTTIISIPKTRSPRTETTSSKLTKIAQNPNESNNTRQSVTKWNSIGGTSVEIEELNFAYNQDTPVLKNVNLSVMPGEVLCILGVSGCGKSTLLRVLAGLETTQFGTIEIGGKRLSGHRPDVTMVFQNFSLFPWKTVEDNVNFAIEQRDLSIDSVKKESMELLELVGLAHKARSYPHQLSGGQQQRVAFARALGHRPRLLLLDEPFSALDSLTRETLQEEVASLFRETGVTALMVTHDIAEAIFMADRIVVMSPSGGHLQNEHKVSASRPRNLEFRNSPEFRQLSRCLWQEMQTKQNSTSENC